MSTRIGKELRCDRCGEYLFLNKLDICGTPDYESPEGWTVQRIDFGYRYGYFDLCPNCTKTHIENINDFIPNIFEEAKI